MDNPFGNLYIYILEVNGTEKKNTSIRLELTGGDKKEDLVVTRRGCIASRLHSGSKVREGRGKSRTVTRNSESGLHKIGRAVALTEPL